MFMKCTESFTKTALNIMPKKKKKKADTNLSGVYEIRTYSIDSDVSSAKYFLI